jgi:hypothetical protein
MPQSDYSSYQQDGSNRHNPQARQIPSPQPLTVVAPRPGYAAPISALDNLSRPEPAAQRSTDYPFGGFGGGPGQNNSYPDNSSSSPLSVPKSPHPLNPPMSPITPIFARASPAPRDVKFEPAQPIMRGNKEETLLPKRGERGDDFWRRFSMVVKEESTAGSAKESIWLRKTQNGTTRLSRWVWIVGLILLIAIAGGIGLGLYFSHNKPDHQRPSAFGGVGDRVGAPEEATAAPSAGGENTARIVSATHTVQRRAPEPTAFRVAAGAVPHLIKPSLKSRHSKKHPQTF